MFLQQTLSTGYPRLLRLFHEFFAKIAVHTDTLTYTLIKGPLVSFHHYYMSNLYSVQETVIVLRALSISNHCILHDLRLNLMNPSVRHSLVGYRTPPGMTEGINIARTVANELDSARFDPLLVKAVAKSATAKYRYDCI